MMRLNVLCWPVLACPEKIVYKDSGVAKGGGAWVHVPPS